MASGALRARSAFAGSLATEPQWWIPGQTGHVVPSLAQAALDEGGTTRWPDEVDACACWWRQPVAGRAHGGVPLEAARLAHGRLVAALALGQKVGGVKAQRVLRRRANDMAALYPIYPGMVVRLIDGGATTVVDVLTDPAGQTEPSLVLNAQGFFGQDVVAPIVDPGIWTPKGAAVR